MKMRKPEHSNASNPNNIIDFAAAAAKIAERNKNAEMERQIDGLEANVEWLYSELAVNPFYQTLDQDSYFATKVPANVIQMPNPKWAA